MASLKRVEHKSGRIVYRIVICMGYDSQGNKLVKNLTYSVNQSATPKQQEKEALKYAMGMEDKFKYGYDYDAEKMSFEDFACKWLENVKDSIAYGTYAGYKDLLVGRILPYFKGYKVAHVKIPLIESFYKTLVDDYSTGTINRYANVLSCIFKTAIRWNMVEHNPCREAQKPKKKNEDARIKYFTPQEARMFLKSLDMSYDVSCKGHKRVNATGKSYHVNDYKASLTVPTQYKVFFSLSLCCGFRKGETLALKWDDIDFDKQEISIKKSIGRTENGFDYKEPKTSRSVRNIPVPEMILPLLKEYKREYNILRLGLGSAWKGNGNLFIQAEGKLMGSSTTYHYFITHLHRYNQWVKEHPEQAKADGLKELPIIPLHGLRHTFATLLNSQGANIIDISKMLGHSNCSTTMNTYAHSFEAQQRETINMINEFLRATV